VESSPVIAGERVICGSSDKNIYMLELSTGKKVWSFEGDGSFVASAALAEGRMVIGCDSGLVYCFELNPGAKGGSK
jgi:outer membrane protein assembly factor BamB